MRNHRIGGMDDVQVCVCILFGCSCVLYRNGMCCIGCENADGPPEMSDHYLYDFGYHYTGAGSWHLFYSVLSGDKSVCNGCCERDRSNKSSFWDCAWNCLHCILSLIHIYKADTLQNSKEYESAILVYQSILNKDWDESVDKKFYGRVYASMGSAYGHQFLYKEAAKAYQEAYKICEQPDILKAYLYSCYKALPHDEYLKMLSGNPILLSLDTILRDEMEKTKKKIGADIPEEKLNEWKKEYRRIDKHCGI